VSTSKPWSLFEEALSNCCLLRAGFFLGLLLNLEDDGDMFFRNVG
jgi:hypothetical protein